MKRIYIDPGHGGNDIGATGNGLAEKEVVLDIGYQMSVYLRNHFDTSEFYRRMSRTTDRFVSLQDRTDDANAWGADVFISIHANGFDGRARGFETYIHDSVPTGARNLQRSMHPTLLNEMRQFDADIPDRGQKTANFHVLRETRMTAILTENLFLDHEKDAKLLQDPNFISAVAAAHAEAIANHLNLTRIDHNTSESDTTDSNTPLHRVIVDGTQEGAYANRDNVLNSVDRNLDDAQTIRIEKV